MKNKKLITQTLSIQSEAIENLSDDKILNQVNEAARYVNDADGITAFSGIGKSGDIARKLVSTFNSIGEQSHYIHPVEALHGDVGVMSEDSVVILISNSGNTEEMVDFLHILRSIDPTTISITSDPTSKLGTQSDHHISTNISREGAIVDLVPMASATATMVIGDCLANVLMNENGFSEEDFAEYHPGGTIGKKLDFEVKDLINGKIDPVDPEISLLEGSLRISEGEKGIVAVVDDSNQVLGVVTDGDLRREISKGTNAEQTDIQQVMTSNPDTMLENKPAIDALKTMEKKNIGQIVLVDKFNKYNGIVHMRDLVREGIT